MKSLHILAITALLGVGFAVTGAAMGDEPGGDKKGTEPKPAEAAKRFGDKLALIAPGRELSFDELEALSNRCANALVGLGVRAGDRVTLYSGNSWE